MKAYVVALALMLLVCGCSSEPQLTKRSQNDDSQLEYKVKVNPCIIKESRDKESVVKFSWPRDNVLHVTVRAYVNCCNKPGNFGLRTQYNQIFLYYEEVGDGKCACMCEHELDWEIKNIIMKNYAYQVQNLPEANRKS